MRQVRDVAGVEWRVYQAERNVPAEQRRDHLLPAEYREGWLVFETDTEKRRLAPVPQGWSTMSDEALAALCATASIQTRRTKTGDPSPTAESRSSLRSELKSAEQRLSETLEEVCDTPEIEKLDTGELIRVEETLAIAGQAAKEAVSLRRKRRGTASEPDQPR